jgi:hypothetical protein
LAELVAAVPDGAAFRQLGFALSSRSDSCFNRHQRDTKFSCSLIFGPFFVAAQPGRRRGPLTASLEERALDMVLGDEIINRLGDAAGIGTGSTRSLPASVKASPSAGSAVTARAYRHSAMRRDA